MIQNREVNVNWLRINVPSIAAVIMAAVTLTVYIQKLEGRLDVIEQSRQARSVVSDKNFDEIQDKLKPLDNVTFRLDQMDKRDDAQDARIDKLLEIMGGKLDGVVDRVNVLSTKVEVLSQKIDSITPQKRAELGLTVRP
jgi:cell division protein ZapA (FtsZ GTPase activity inhibitor)